MPQWRLTKKEESDDFAGDVAEGPRAAHGTTDNERGQGQHLEEIRHGEVGHVDDGAAPAARPTAHAPQLGTV